MLGGLSGSSQSRDEPHGMGRREIHISRTTYTPMADDEEGDPSGSTSWAASSGTPRLQGEEARPGPLCNGQYENAMILPTLSRTFGGRPPDTRH